MTLPKICTDAELQYFTGELSGTDLTLLQQTRDWVESAARQFVRHQITYNTFTEFYPKSDTHSTATDELLDLAGISVVSGVSRSGRSVIVLSQKYVKTIISVHEDPGAEFGKGENDFGSDTLLTEGTDYVLDQVSANFSTTGRLYRLNTSWPAAAGTVKVVFTAGLTESELNDEFQFVKRAIADEVTTRYWTAKERKNRIGAGAGIVSSTGIQGDFSERYDTSIVINALQSELMTGTKRRLAPIRHRMTAL